MTAADKIASARALIEPLTGHTSETWQTNCDEVWADDISIAQMEFDCHMEFGEQEANARLIAAAPALRDTVAALADLAAAQAQEIARLTDMAVKAATDALLEMDLRNVEVAEYVAARIRAALGETP